MIKAQFFNNGYFYLTILNSDGTVQFRECPASWFEQARDGNGMIKVTLAWPPPFMPNNRDGNGPIIDKSTAIESISIVKDQA